MLRILLSFVFLLPAFTYANEKEVIWSAKYYDAVPNQKGISADYCQQHTPGTFVGAVKEQLKFGAITDRGIKLDHFTFNSKKIAGISFIEGSLRARGETQKTKWEDHLHYYVYKLSEYGLTRGVWQSKECKGFFVGKAISRK